MKYKVKAITSKYFNAVPDGRGAYLVAYLYNGECRFGCSPRPLHLHIMYLGI